MGPPWLAEKKYIYILKALHRLTLTYPLTISPTVSQQKLLSPTSPIETMPLEQTLVYTEVPCFLRSPTEVPTK